MNLSTTFATFAIALTAAGAASASSAITSEGFVLSAPAFSAPSTIDRAQVRAEIPAAVRQNMADPLAAEGRGTVKSQPGSTRTRAQVRTEAIAAVRANYADPIAAAGERAAVRSYAPADVTVGIR